MPKRGCHPERSEGSPGSDRLVGEILRSAQDDRTADAENGSNPTAGTLVSLTIEQAEPLVGTATCARGSPVPFVGWLELLRAVSELVAAEGQPEDTRPAAARRVTE